MRASRCAILITALAVGLGVASVAEAQRVQIKITERRLTLGSAHEYDGAISGDWKVYTETSSGTEDVFRVGDPGDNYPVAFGPGAQHEADINGNLVVYTDNSAGQSEIYWHNFVAPYTERLSFNPADEVEPRISGTNVVYLSDRSGNLDVFAYIGSLEQEWPIATTGLNESNADIDGNLVVWQVFESGSSDVYGMELDVGTPFPIALGPGAQHRARVSGDRVAYIVDDDVAVYDHSVPSTTLLTDDAYVQDYVVITGQYVYFRDDRNGNFDVFVRDLGNGQTHQLTDDPSDQTPTGADGQRVLYHDDRTGDFNVWIAEWEYNTPPIADAGDDQQVFVGETVQLDGSAWDPDFDPITGWLWAFESMPDGSAAVLSNPGIRNPTFVPELPGDYELSLIVSDGLDPSDPDTMTVTAVPLLPGDCNGDGVVDELDWPLFADCISGPDVPSEPGCDCADDDCDLDVDLADFAAFQVVFGQ